MGKRELLLIVAFVITGAVVYEITAPAPRAGERSVTFSSVLANIRRAVHGNRGRAELTHSTTHAVSRQAAEVRLSGPFAEITIQGEDRADIASDLRVFSTGFDEAEARGLADRTVLKVDEAGPTIGLQVDYPAEGRQNSSITLRVPKRLRVRIEQSGMRTSIADVASAELVSSHGETTVKQIAGRVAMTHRGGRAVIEGAGSVKLASRGGDTRITRVAGDASFDLQGGELQGSDIAGPVDIESRSADITLRADQARGPIRVNASGGAVSIENVKGDLRVDGRNTEVTATIAPGAGSVAIYGQGNEDIRVTPPAGGYELDAVATEGRITVPEHTVEVSASGNEHRANGRVGAGGPTITLRASHGDIVIRP